MCVCVTYKPRLLPGYMLHGLSYIFYLDTRYYSRRTENTRKDMKMNAFGQSSSTVRLHNRQEGYKACVRAYTHTYASK